MSADMNKTELQRVLKQIEHEALSPTVHTVDDYLHLFANYRKVLEQEQTNFPTLEELPSVDKFYCDYLTWKFSFIFNQAGKKCPENGISGYEALIKLNENNHDFSHAGREFSPFSCLAELHTFVGNRYEAERYLAQERVRKKNLVRGEEVFHQGIDEHRDRNFESAAARYRECLQTNSYHTKARVLLGFLHSTSINLEELFYESGKEMIVYSEESFGGIPLAKISESDNPKGIEINLGVNFQSQYYRKINPEDLMIFFVYDRFGESNNLVFKYVRDFSEKLQKLMVNYSPLLKRSAFKFYREGPKKETGLLPSKLERIGLKYFGEMKEINVPKREREPARGEPDFIELKLIEGMSMYDFLRTMEQLKVTPELKTALTDALVHKQIQDLVKIQNSTAELRQKRPGTAVEMPQYSEKLRKAFEGDDGLIVLMKKHFELDLSYPQELEQVGTELDKIVNDEEKLVVYKDASPRNTKINFRGVAKEMKLTEAREVKDIVKLVLEECERGGLLPERLAQAFAHNLYQLDFEKINRLAHEFDDLVEIIECTYFNPSRNGEQKWNEMYQFFLGLKGKEDSEDIRRKYHLISLNRNVRWIYFLMKWFDRSVTKGSPERQHLDDLDSHINGAYRAINELKGGSYNLREVEKMLEQIKSKNEK